ncbi:uncharacterized protein LOC131994160 [Stomoxys calcitrans]|uniref:uncharacterized protein LOC131994160 n=1 Tax=Stomoxys calcitrans TaxID=35570 RepID=UPI0027E304D8|nr:uncharacterized protein LOC131994160 [Stomoxys calcitrans]XP_059216549.1 uncharacterized protein LOC131994160 [Stomoxys calcitrans]XP_059216550.1 uncharacterized protein LOC131994160 [Stomoxys calcitrans]XP_059216551.1 uncharacterized protein LOC131994160 [Stomoxys calcitrans]XP_059216552.1 uncharacterized protein LOC131994160 [Stomoxys calcitrans]XP_059216553.1 uncharacterized protein LOC131994160 [Stomoxys calcitrans]
MDFDDELESHYIRKDEFLRHPQYDKTAKYNRDNPYKDASIVHDYIPAMVMHLTSLNESCWLENSIISILEGRLRFKNCLLYGNVLDKAREQNARHVYTFDDGTECIEISLFTNDKNINAVIKLQGNLYDIIGCSEKKIATSLSNILSASKKQINTPNIKAGTKVLLYGKPSFYCNKVSLDVYNVLQDNSTDRSVEIAFNDELLAWHKKYTLS